MNRGPVSRCDHMPNGKLCALLPLRLEDYLPLLRTCWLILWLLALASVSQGAESKPDTALFPVTEFTLTNGLQVLTLEDHSSPLVAVQVWYHVGSADEPRGRHGFAHLFEHMMFRGTDRLGPTDHFDLLHSIGGECNAYTAFDETCYHETLPAQQLELALWLECERMAFLTVDGPGFTTERKVVEEERRLTLGLPYGELADKGPPVIFGQHPYGHDPLGTLRDLRQATPSDVHSWWTSRYTPNNATLVIVGDVKADHVRALSERYFAWIPSVPQDPHDIPILGAWDSAQGVTINLANAPAPGVGLVWRTVPEGQPDTLALDLLEIILGGDAIATVQGAANSSRLYRKLVVEDQLAVMATAMQFSAGRAGVFGAGAALSPLGGDTTKTLSVLRGEMERLCRDGVTDEELEKAKNLAGLGLVREAQTVEGKASLIGRAAVLGTGVGELNSRLERLRRFGREDLRRAAQTHLDLKHAMAVTVPASSLWGQLARLFSTNHKTEEAAPAAFASNMLLRGRPGVTRPDYLPVRPPLRYDPPTVPVPAIEEHHLANGLRVLVAQRPNTQIVHVVFAVPFGSWAEEKPGTAGIALRLLSKGTELHDEKALAEELDRYGIQLSGAASKDDSRVQLSCFADNAERAFSLLGEVVTRPSFPQSHLGTTVAQARTELQLFDTTPYAVAEREFEHSLFLNHPYGRRVLGEPADLAALKVEDLAAFWRRIAQPNQASLIIAGGITSERALALAKRCFADWRPNVTASGGATGTTTEAGGAAVRAPSTPRDPGPLRILLIDWPGADQSQICMGGLGITNTDPDKPIANLVGSYFGGTFGSRLMKAVRVEKGDTYGALGGFEASRFAGAFVVHTFTKTSSTAETIRTALAEIKGLQERPPSPEELASHKRFFVGSAAARYETPEQIASQFAHIALNRLPLDYLQRSLGAIASATADQCQGLARRVVDPSRLIIVVVGDASSISKDLEKIAPVTILARSP